MTKLDLLVSAARAQSVDRIETGPKLRTYPQGRVCQTEDCGTILSRYNRGRTCASCTPPSKRT